MAGFMNREIEAVEPTVGARRNQAEPAVHGQNYGEAGPPAPLAIGIVDRIQVSSPLVTGTQDTSPVTMVRRVFVSRGGRPRPAV
jgi:hypothetical protein